MTQEQISSLRRLKAVRRQLDTYSSSWTGSVGIERAAADLDLLFADLEEVARLQGEGSKPTTAEKRQMSQALRLRLEEACSHLTDMAVDRDLPNVQELTRRRSSQIARLTAEALVAYAQLILQRLETYSDDLEEWGYYSSDREALLTDLDQFASLMDAPRAVISQRHGGTLRVDSILGEGMDILTLRLDRLLKRYQKTDPSFYHAYRAARKRVRPSVEHEKPEDGVSMAA